MKLVLFDIDGTLLLSGGAGVRAMTRAFDQLFEIADAFTGVQLAGRTDTSILKDALRLHGLPYSHEVLEEFQSLYFEYLHQEMPLPGSGKRIMPGVLEVLEALSALPDVYLGLLTGNWRTSGYIKLADFALDHFFAFGAFSDDSEVRKELLPFAIQRFKRLHDLEPRPEEVFVVGDTPSDILCAHPHGAKAVAVAAAHHSAADLAPYNPDFLLPNLTDYKKVLEILG